MVDLEINLDRKLVYFLIGIFIVFIVVGLIVAYGGSDPSVHGHDSGELEGVCLSDGTNCPSSLTPDCYVKEAVFTNGVQVCCNTADYIPVSWATNQSQQTRTSFTGSNCVRFTNPSGGYAKVKCCKATLA